MSTSRTRIPSTAARAAFRMALVFALLGLGGMDASPARAAFLSELLAPGATILSGDKLFSDFTYAPGGDMPAATLVTVTPVSFGDLEHGLIFGGPFLDLPGGGASTAILAYTVTALDPGQLIVDNHLFSNVRLTPPTGTGTISVAESVEAFAGTSPGPVLGLKQVFATNLPPVPPSVDQLDSLTFAPQRRLRITKDITALSLTGLAEASFIRQTFTQVPEPGSLALLGIGTAGALGASWRRRRSRAV